MKCPDCSTEVTGTARFCPGCGRRLVGAAREEPPPLPEAGERAWDEEEPPEPPPPAADVADIRRGAGAGAGIRRRLAGVMGGEGKPVELPAAGEVWAWRHKSTEWGRRLLGGKGGAGVNAAPASRNMLDRMVRASLLDKSVYREVAANTRLNAEALLVAALVIGLSSLGWQLLTFRMWTLEGATTLAATAVVQAAAWLVRVWVIRFAAAKWFGRKAGFATLFRSVTYAQSVAALQVIPVAGTVLSLWALVTTAAAIRDVTACDTKAAWILAVAGAVVVAVAVAVAGPAARAVF